MSSQKPDPIDLESLQRKADAIRADMDRTLEALEHKISPREVMDRSMNFARERGLEALEKARTTAAKHPVPLMLASAGVLWLASKRRKRRAHARTPSIARRHEDFDRSAQTFRGDDAFEGSSTANHAVSRAIASSPLVYGTLAVGLGAALAAAIPPSRYERSLLQRARHSVGPLLERAAENLRARAGRTL